MYPRIIPGRGAGSKFEASNARVTVIVSRLQVVGGRSVDDQLEIRFDAGGRLIQNSRGGFRKGGVLLVVERIDTELHEASGKQIQQFLQRLGGEPSGAGIVHEQRNAACILRVWARIKRGHIDAEGQ